MIKVALKHWIYEKCIDLLFDNITRNFVHPHEFVPGAYFDTMVYKSRDGDVVVLKKVMVRYEDLVDNVVVVVCEIDGHCTGNRFTTGLRKNGIINYD